MANGRPFTPTGRVPDMLSRVSCGHDSNNFSNLEAVRDDLSKVRNDIDSLRESLNETKTNVVANSRDILARCSFYTETKRAEGSPDASSVSGKSRVSDGSSMGMREGGDGRGWLDILSREEEDLEGIGWLCFTCLQITSGGS